MCRRGASVFRGSFQMIEDPQNHVALTLKVPQDRLNLSFRFRVDFKVGLRAKSMRPFFRSEKWHPMRQLKPDASSIRCTELHIHKRAPTTSTTV
jgi:hypothetical protein